MTSWYLSVLSNVAVSKCYAVFRATETPPNATTLQYPVAGTILATPPLVSSLHISSWISLDQLLLAGKPIRQSSFHWIRYFVKEVFPKPSAQRNCSGLQRGPLVPIVSTSCRNSVTDGYDHYQCCRRKLVMWLLVALPWLHGRSYGFPDIRP